MRWSYGITTVPERKKDLFPKTLESLRAAGFDQPHIFVDNCKDSKSYLEEFGLEVTARYPRVRTAGHWLLTLGELYIRNPTAERYAVFQDDFITVKNLRGYLEKVGFPPLGYLNLYTFPSQQIHAPKDRLGFYPSTQNGRGAVALVFDLKALQLLLTHPYMIERPRDAHRGHKAIDGGVINTMRLLKGREYVHNPSLVQHTGDFSSMGNQPHKKAVSFPGEEFDALTLLDQPKGIWG